MEAPGSRLIDCGRSQIGILSQLYRNNWSQAAAFHGLSEE